MKKHFNFPLLLLCVWFIEFLWSYFCAYDVNVWYVEISSVVFAVLLLSLTYKKFQFSNLTYFVVFLWIFLHTVGACYTFERVPFLDIFGVGRNNFFTPNKLTYKQGIKTYNKVCKSIKIISA